MRVILALEPIFKLSERTELVIEAGALKIYHISCIATFNYCYVVNIRKCTLNTSITGEINQ